MLLCWSSLFIFVAPMKKFQLNKCILSMKLMLLCRRDFHSFHFTRAKFIQHSYSRNAPPPVFFSPIWMWTSQSKNLSSLAHIAPQLALDIFTLFMKTFFFRSIIWSYNLCYTALQFNFRSPNDFFRTYFLGLHVFEALFLILYHTQHSLCFEESLSRKFVWR